MWKVPPMNTSNKNVAQWREYVSGCLDFRPAEGVYRIARDMFTEPDLFDPVSYTHLTLPTILLV